MRCVISMIGAFTLDKLCLHGFEHFRRNDGRMTVFNVILGNLALVHFHFLGQKIRAEGLLQDGVALVFLVGQNAFYRFWPPLRPPGRRRNIAGGKEPRDVRRRFSLHEQAIDQLDRRSFLGHDFWNAIRTLFIAEKLLISPIWMKSISSVRSGRSQPLANSSAAACRMSA